VLTLGCSPVSSRRQLLWRAHLACRLLECRWQMGRTLAEQGRGKWQRLCHLDWGRGDCPGIVECSLSLTVQEAHPRVVFGRKQLSKQVKGTTLRAAGAIATQLLWQI